MRIPDIRTLLCYLTVFLMPLASAHASDAAVSRTTLQTVVSAYVGHPTLVSCEPDSTFEALDHTLQGYVLPNPDGSLIYTIHIRESICAAIGDFSGVIPVDYLVLVHEATHLKMQSVNESCVQKAAVANVWSLIRHFKFPAWLDRTILRGIPAANTLFLANYHDPC